MLNICLSSDYELYFGDNFTDEVDVLIHPTTRLLDALDAQQVPMTFFVDVCSAIVYRDKLPNSSFITKLEQQIIDIIKRGHDVQLHLHPHWFDSEYQSGKWQFKYDRYRIHEWGFSDNGFSAHEIIRLGIAYLNDLILPIKPDYQCVGYRAGGWCLQPEEPLLSALSAQGVWIDSTIFKNGYSMLKDKWYDFRQAPKLASWWVDPHWGLAVKALKSEHAVLEVSIGSYHHWMRTFFRKIKYRLDRRRHKKMPLAQRGTSMDVRAGDKSSLFKTITEAFTKPILLTYDNACAQSMIDIVNSYLKKAKTDHTPSYLSVIGHPKTINDDDISEIVKFIEHFKRNHSDDVQFVTIADIAQREQINE